MSAEGEPRRVAPGETGMLLVSGPNVFGGYLGVDADKQPFVAFEGMEWYRTGDLVSEAADGCLTFRGRLKRFVKVGGEMDSPPQIESVLAAAFGEDVPKNRRTGPALAVESGEDGAIVLFTTLDITREEANAALRAARLSGLSAVARVQKTGVYPGSGNRKDRLQGAQGVLRLRRLVRGEVHSKRPSSKDNPRWKAQQAFKTKPLRG